MPSSESSISMKCVGGKQIMPKPLGHWLETHGVYTIYANKLDTHTKRPLPHCESEIYIDIYIIKHAHKWNSRTEIDI